MCVRQGSLVAIDGRADVAGTDSTAGATCKTNLVVRMWLESPKLLLSAYVGAIAQHDVAGGRIRTMADLKSLGEPEGEVHLDQLMSVAGRHMYPMLVYCANVYGTSIQ